MDERAAGHDRGVVHPSLKCVRLRAPPADTASTSTMCSRSDNTTVAGDDAVRRGLAHLLGPTSTAPIPAVSTDFAPSAIRVFQTSLVSAVERMFADYQQRKRLKGVGTDCEGSPPRSSGPPAPIWSTSGPAPSGTPSCTTTQQLIIITPRIDAPEQQDQGEFENHRRPRGSTRAANGKKSSTWLQITMKGRGDGADHPGCGWDGARVRAGRISPAPGE